MKIAFCGYRDWALEIYKKVNESFENKIEFVQVFSKTDFEIFVEEKIIDQCDLLFFVGWSWIIKKEIVDNYKCICLHPSPLPRYRGGSPLQHQIINGETESAVTYFIMNDKIDQGKIVFQSSFNLNGELEDILKRIVAHGYLGMSLILSEYKRTGKIKSFPQDELKKTYYKRRTPEQSELTESDFETAKKAYNKIRALNAEDYPRAYITCKDGSSLYIEKSSISFYKKKTYIKNK